MIKNVTELFPPGDRMEETGPGEGDVCAVADVSTFSSNVGAALWTE